MMKYGCNGTLSPAGFFEKDEARAVYSAAPNGKETLCTLKDGQAAVILDVYGNEDMRGRLYDLGFTPGARVRSLFAAAAGDPRAYLVRGTVIALRCADAECVALRRPVVNGSAEHDIWA